MVDFFANLGPLQHLTCNDCGTEYTTHLKGSERCTQCAYYRDYPEEAPKYWTWTRRGRNASWTVSAYWPDREPLPEVGDTITVHRKDGTSSVETITEVDGLRYLPDGNPRLHCWVT